MSVDNLVLPVTDLAVGIFLFHPLSVACHGKGAGEPLRQLGQWALQCLGGRSWRFFGKNLGCGNCACRSLHSNFPWFKAWFSRLLAVQRIGSWTVLAFPSSAEWTTLVDVLVPIGEQVEHWHDESLEHLSFQLQDLVGSQLSPACSHS